MYIPFTIQHNSFVGSEEKGKESQLLRTNQKSVCTSASVLAASIPPPPPPILNLALQILKSLLSGDWERILKHGPAGGHGPAGQLRAEGAAERALVWWDRQKANGGLVD